jgi:hypothetical protein
MRLPTFEIGEFDVEKEWEKEVRNLPIEQRIERVKLGFCDPDITKESLT